VLILDRALLGLIGIIQIPMDDCLVGACLVCGLVMCAGWLHCSCHALESDGALERLLPSCGTGDCMAILSGLEIMWGLHFAPFGSEAW